jgi:hypothetical protein
MDMDAPDLKLTLVLAKNDPPIQSVATQKELLQFWQAMLRQGVRIEYEWPPFFGGARAIPPPMLGDFFVKLAPTVGPIVGTALGAWLHAHYGRRVRLKFGDVEAEAQNVEELEKLLACAQELQQHNQPKIIQKP